VGYRDDTAGAVYHIVTDEAGSVRAMTNSTGVKQFESDYYPQGGQRAITTTKDSLLKFQAKQLDTESGLENAARLYSSATGRFLSVAAKPAKKTTTPQALNKVSAPAAKPLNAFTSSVGSILGAVRSALSSYRQCTQNAMDLANMDPFLDFFGPPSSWAEILCGPPDFGLGDFVSCTGILIFLPPGPEFQGFGCSYGVLCEDASAGVFEWIQPCAKCAAKLCPLTAHFLAPPGTTTFKGHLTALTGFPTNFCNCD
jgi:hypothetical protein